ncbi:MAG TPA: PaaI family thioesterase [Thermoleophilaceae bacterium]|jgi:uncharacterized protein (TIGR00369 family)
MTSEAAPHARPLEMSGLEHLEAILDGHIPPPPIAELMGFELVEVGHGRATFAVEPGVRHYNPIGVVHGGLAATLLDSAMGCAVQTTLDAGTGYTTLDLSTTFLRPMTSETGRVVCEAVVIHSGSRIATAEGRVFSARTGKLIATGTSSCVILPAPAESD